MYLEKNQVKNEKVLDELLGINFSFDMGKRELYLKEKRNLIYTNNFLVNTDLLIQIIQSLFYNEFDKNDTYFNNVYKFLSTISVSLTNNFDDIQTEVVKGLACIIVGDYDTAIIIDIRNYPTRGLTEPDGERVVRGSREGFTENIATNVALVRRRVRTPNLKVLKFVIGSLSKIEIAVVYIENLVNKKALDIAIKRINSIEITELTMTDKALEELLTTRPYSPYPVVRYTERPDTLAVHLYQGLFGIIVDTSPSVMIAPTNLFDHFQAAEEYRQTSMCGTFLRLIRFFGIIVSFILVPLWLCYVNKGYFTNSFLDSVMNINYSKQNILVQLILSEFSIELVRMASIHTPDSLSTSMGLIVGIILGGIGVELGIVSQTIVFLGALSAIGTYITPSYELALVNKIIKLIFILVSYYFDIIGLVVMISLIFIYLLSLKSFGESYLKPLIPFYPKQLIRQFIRSPYKNYNKE